MQGTRSKINTVLIGAVVVVLIALGITLATTRNNPLPDTGKPSSNKIVYVGQSFHMTPGQTGTIADSYGATFQLTGFYYHPCPANVNCIWSGLDIFYTIEIPEVTNADGSIQQHAAVYTKDSLKIPDGIPFAVSVKDSDYKTYAELVLQKKGASTSSQSQIIQNLINAGKVDVIYRFSYQGKTYYHATDWEVVGADGTPDVYGADGTKIECNWGSPMVPSTPEREAQINPICHAYHQDQAELIYNRKVN